jgi:hypothetical protein
MCPLMRPQLYTCTGRREQKRCRGYGASRRSVGRQSCKTFSKKNCVTATANFFIPGTKMVTVTGGSSERDAPGACPLKDHSFTWARGEQAKWLRGSLEKRRSSVTQDDKLPPAVFAEGLRDRNCPIYTFSQNCYGARRVKARKYICFLTLAEITALHPRARGEEKKCRGYAASRKSVAHQHCRMTHCRLPGRELMRSEPKYCVYIYIYIYIYIHIYIYIYI